MVDYLNWRTLEMCRSSFEVSLCLSSGLQPLCSLVCVNLLWRSFVEFLMSLEYFQYLKTSGLWKEKATQRNNRAPPQRCRLALSDFSSFLATARIFVSSDLEL